MSKTRFDRKPRPTEEWRTDYFPLGGGMDQRSSALAIKPGRLVQCLNFEEVYGQQGYSFVLGHERFDGRTSPSSASYDLLPFREGATAIAVGNTVTNATTATGIVAGVTLTSGSWVGGDAVGYLVLVSTANDWADGEDIRVGGVKRAEASDELTPGSLAVEDHYDHLRTAREYLRSLIQKPAGAGDLLGGCVFSNVVYVVRNIADNSSATLWRSTTGGWVSVRTGLPPSTTYRFTVDNFTGDPTNLCMFGVNGVGRLFQVDRNNAFTYAGPIFGTEGTSTSNVLIGTGAKTFTTQTSLAFVAGQTLRISQQTNWGNSMTGTVTAYNSGTGQLDMNITSVTGAGTINSWEIGLADFTDKPYLVRGHKDHLFLGYPLGQVQSSNLGAPLVYTGTATLFGMGQELTGLQSLKGKVLGVFCESKISLLSGSSSTDWDLSPHSTSTGAVLDTVEDNDGNGMFMQGRGLTNMQGTLNFGDFEAANFSLDVMKIIKARRTETVVGSRMTDESYQYRLYYEDGTALRFTFLNGAPVLSPKDVSCTISKYDFEPTCMFSGKIDGITRMFIGTADGYLMEEDAGTSYDGEAIDYVVRLPFNHGKSPANDKQYHKGELELVCPDEVTFYFRAIYEYDDGEMPFGPGEVTLLGEGGQWDIDNWDMIRWDLPTNSRLEFPMDGQARNVGLLIWAQSDIARPAQLQGVFEYFSLLALRH